MNISSLKMFYNLDQVCESPEWDALERTFPAVGMQLRLWRQFLASTTDAERLAIHAKASALEELLGELAERFT